MTDAKETKETKQTDGDDLHDDVMETLRNRVDYDDNLRTIYNVRRDGVKRLDPQPWQSDTPVKIADPAIDKIKPTLIAGIYQREAICTFQTKKRELVPHKKKLSNWLTYRMKCETNFFRNCVISVDTSLETAKAVWKTIYDYENNCVSYDCVHPGYFIVPEGTDTLDKAPWFVEVKEMSVSEYEANTKYEQDTDFVKSITGKGQTGPSNQTQLTEAKYDREGLTYSGSKNRIIVWERYRKDGKQWKVRWYSPLQPSKDIRAEQAVPHWGGKMHPYTAFDAELCSKGWYAPRGMVEKSLPEEIIATMYRNLMMDWMQFAGVPIFTTDGTGINLANYQFKPGDVIPGNVRAVEFPVPPEAMMQQMMLSKEYGQELVGSPNLGLGESSSAGNQKQTATAVNRITQNNSLTTDLRSRLFYESLSDVFLKTYLLYVENDPEGLDYVWNDEVDSIPGDALVDAYKIHPSGNPDGMGREYERAMAQQVYEASLQNPRNMNVDESSKMYLETLGTEYVQRIYRPSGMAIQGEQEDQTKLLLLMADPLTEYAAQANPADDHETRITTSIQFLRKLFTERKKISPRSEDLIKVNLGQHLQFLAKQNPQLAKQMAAQIAQMQQQAQGQLAMEAEQLQKAQIVASHRNGAPPVAPPVPPLAPQPQPVGMPA